METRGDMFFVFISPWYFILESANKTFSSCSDHGCRSLCPNHLIVCVFVVLMIYFPSFLISSLGIPFLICLKSVLLQFLSDFHKEIEACKDQIRCFCSQQAFSYPSAFLHHLQEQTAETSNTNELCFHSMVLLHHTLSITNNARAYLAIESLINDSKVICLYFF